MSRTGVTIETRDGACGASLFTPDTGAGPWPAVLVFMDGRGIRPALFELGERVAGAGYCVLLPDLYYRVGPYEAPSASAFSRDLELRARWLATYAASANPANVRVDTAACLAFLAARAEVSSLSIGTTGYCMGGGMSLAAAANFPERVVAAASYHGGNLASDAADSPHRMASRIKARVYVACAVEDASFPDEQKQRLIESFESAGVRYVLETYAGAKHGWVPSDSVVYDRAASERHYASLLALFDATLKHAALKG